LPACRDPLESVDRVIDDPTGHNILHTSEGSFGGRAVSAVRSWLCVTTSRWLCLFVRPIFFYKDPSFMSSLLQG
jgi:hypothetical protein